MKNKLKLDAIRVSSFITRTDGTQIKGGTGTIDYSAQPGCSSRCPTYFSCGGGTGDGGSGSGGTGVLSDQNCVV